MESNDLFVEVRDRNLARVGQIRPEDLDLDSELEFSNVGTWTIKLPAEDAMAAYLHQPGSGIIVSGPTDVLFSGPMTNAQLDQSVDDPMGTWTFVGATDEIVLADSLAYPDPANGNAATQAVSYDTQTGQTETLMHHFVNANVGPDAPDERRGLLAQKLVMGPNLQRGPVAAKSARFNIIGDLLGDLCLPSNLGFRVVQRGTDLRFETFEVNDLTRLVRLSVWNNSLSSSSSVLHGPTATRVIVAGEGDAEDRAFLVATSEDAISGEEAWGRRIERWVDQQAATDDEEYQQAADEVLAAEGATAASVSITPTDSPTMAYLHDWNLGDQITVDTNDDSYVVPVSAVKITSNTEGTRVLALLGDPSNLSSGFALDMKLASTTKRLTALERSK